MSNESPVVTNGSPLSSLAGFGLVLATAMTALAVLAVLAAVGLGAVSLALGSVVEPTGAAKATPVVARAAAGDASAPLAQASYHQTFGLSGGE